MTDIFISSLVLYTVKQKRLVPSSPSLCKALVYSLSQFLISHYTYNNLYYNRLNTALCNNLALQNCVEVLSFPSHVQLDFLFWFMIVRNFYQA